MAHGHEDVTKTLHWSTVLAIGGQFAIGYTMATDRDVPDVDCDPAREDRSGGDTSETAEERLDRAEERCEAEQDAREEKADDALGTAWSDLGSGDLFDEGVTGAETHVLLGLVILLLAVLRVVWRRRTTLPPWDPRLTPMDRRLGHLTEVALLTLQFLVPLSGILLVLVSDDLVALHVAAHVAFFVALAAHLAMVLGKGLLPRMLPGVRSSSAAPPPASR